MKEGKKNPAIAAALNFLIWGLGYVYLSNAWNMAVIILIIPLAIGLSNYDFLYLTAKHFFEFLSLDWLQRFFFLTVSGILAWHAYEIAKGKEKV